MEEGRAVTVDVFAGWGCRPEVAGGEIRLEVWEFIEDEDVEAFVESRFDGGNRLSTCACVCVFLVSETQFKLK